jgi:EAL domain-containing protein (putative c-di-GMP-specific phosphodiesterase class I)
VAEGVETEPQMDMLRALGCDAVQGFLLGRPMTIEPLKAWLHKRTPDSISNLVPLRVRNAREPG